MPNENGKPKNLTLEETKKLWEAQGVIVQTYKGICNNFSTCQYVWNKIPFTEDGQEIHAWSVIWDRYAPFKERIRALLIYLGIFPYPRNKYSNQ